MVVYVLSVVWQCDSGEFGNDFAVYDSWEKAKVDMLDQIESAKKDFADLETEEDNYVDGDMSWSIWEKDEYAYNHIDIMVKALEVI